MNNDKEFDNTEKLVKRGMFVILAVWAAGAITSLTLTGLIIYVAVHFIGKYW